MTHRSNAIGLAMCLPAEEDGKWRIPFITAVPSSFGKGVEACLMQLCLGYLKTKGAKHISVEVHPELEWQYEK